MSERVDRVLRKSLNPDPQQRPASCRAFVDELLGQEPCSAAPDVDVWFVTYEDARGKPVLGVGNARRVQRLLRERPPGNPHAARAGRTWDDQKRLLSSIPEFQGLTDEEREEAPAIPEKRLTAAAREAGPAAPDLRECPKPDAAAGPALDRFGWPVFLAVALGAVLLGFLLFPGK